MRDHIKAAWAHDSQSKDGTMCLNIGVAPIHSPHRSQAVASDIFDRGYMAGFFFLQGALS